MSHQSVTHCGLHINGMGMKNIRDVSYAAKIAENFSNNKKSDVKYWGSRNLFLRSYRNGVTVVREKAVCVRWND